MEDWKDKPLNRPFRIPASREGSVKNNESEIILLKKRAKELLSSLEQKSEFLVPSGSISMFAGSEAPDSWLLCDGSTVSRTDYANLFAVIGTSYGAGNGSTTFGLPDMRFQFPRGSGTGLGLGTTGGATEHNHTISHTHQVTMTPSGSLNSQGSHGHSVSISSSGSGNTGGPLAGPNQPIGTFNFREGGGTIRTVAASTHVHNRNNHTHTVSQSDSGGHSHTFTGTSNTVTSAAASNTNSGNNDHLPPFVTVNYIIKA